MLAPPSYTLHVQPAPLKTTSNKFSSFNLRPFSSSTYLYRTNNVSFAHLLAPSNQLYPLLVQLG
jgi:hypothetical protein